jgi:hypothetical protein
MDQKNNLQKKVGIFFSIVVALGVLFVSIFLGRQPDTTQVADQTSSSNSNVTPPAYSTQAGSQNSTPPNVKIAAITPMDKPKNSASIYKNGTYSATGSYMSPGGEDQIAVTLTLKNDIVTSVSATPEAGDRMSARFQNMFISGYQQYVIGKNISSLNLTKVSGSSLTPKGFDSALAQIKSQAKA